MSRRQVILIGLVLLAACVLPFVVSNYRTFQFTLALVYAIALLGLNMLTGYNGQISLGHGAFYAVGAYTAASLMEHFGMPYWATIPIAAAVCLVAGFLFGLPALRATDARPGGDSIPRRHPGDSGVPRPPGTPATRRAPGDLLSPAGRIARVVG